MRRSTFPLLAALSLASCSKRDPAPSANVSASAAPSASVAPPAPSPATPAPSSSATAGARPASPAETLLFAWNAALNRRAVAELQPFYGSAVLFYGRRLTRAQVLDAKHAAFQKTPDFQQRLSRVSIARGPNGFVVRFEKQSGEKLEQTVAARLVLEQAAGALEIVEESDDVTDRRVADAEPTTCPEAVWRIAEREPSIVADRARVAREGYRVTSSGMSFDLEDRPDRAQISIGYMHPERFESRWFADASGKVLVLRDAYTGQRFRISPAQQAWVTRLCTDGEPPEGANWGYDKP